jgi:hypothetical protein
MNNLISIAALVGILGGIIYKYDRIKIEFLKQKGV